MRVLIAGVNSFPAGDAGALREETLAKLIKSMGHEVMVVGLGKSTGLEWREYKGISYLSLRKGKRSLVTRFLDREMYYSRLKRYVLEQQGFDAIVITGGSVKALARIKKYASHRGIRLVFDCVEWYSPEQFALGSKSKAYRDRNYIVTRLIDKQFGVIAISSYLERYFRDKEITTVRIPAILDVLSMSPSLSTENERTVFMYSGVPGRKDYLKEMIAGFGRLNPEEIEALEIRLVGVTLEQLVEKCGVSADDIDKLRESLKCYGRIPHDEVLKMLKTADYTVLLRRGDLRYAKAGFPTKFVESLSIGTPVICNLTSDLGMFVNDGRNSLIVESCSAEDMARSVRKALCLDAKEKRSLREEARNTAERYFDYHQFHHAMETVLGRNGGLES